MILSINRSRRWPNYILGAAVLAVVAYVFHEAGAQGVEPSIPQTIAVAMPVVAPPSPNAEPELVPMPAASPAVRLTLPAPVPVSAEEPPPELEIPRPTAHVTAMIKQGKACALARSGVTADQVIQRIVEREGTITTAQMEGIRRFEARCLSPDER